MVASKKESSSATAREKKLRHRSACAGPTRSNSVRRKSTNPRKFGLSCSLIHSACTKLFGSGCGAREAQSRYSHSATTRTESAAARLRRFAHDRLEAYGRLRIGIGCAPGLGDTERFECPKEIGVFLGRHHADEATKAQPGRERVGASKRRTEKPSRALMDGPAPCRPIRFETDCYPALLYADASVVDSVEPALMAHPLFSP